MTDAVQTIAGDLGFIEGPVSLADGSTIVVGMSRGELLRVAANGEVTVLAETGGSPNGAAIGPDGRCYVCNSGGYRWHTREGLIYPGLPSDDYLSGWIDAIDLTTGNIQRLYDRCGDVFLKGPNDLVFDRHGGFWFTDHGKVHRYHRDRGAVYYAAADGSQITQVIFPLETPNGIGLSPDQSELYVAETITGRIWAFEIVAPGKLLNTARGAPFAVSRLVTGLPGEQMFDSLAIDSNGNICVATIPTGISIISPAGELLDQVAMPEPLVTNICFGGKDEKTAYVTLSAAGQLIAMPWEVSGLTLNYSSARA